MRLPLLAAAAATALTLSACRNNDQHDNTANVDENLTAESIVSNDVTAIDAVTGDAANMAADVNYMDVPNGLDNEASANTSAPSPSKPRPKTAPAPAKSRPEPSTATTPTTTTTNAE
jgi:hypothetical protein